MLLWRFAARHDLEDSLTNHHGGPYGARHNPLGARVMVTLAVLTLVTAATSILGVIALVKHYHSETAYARSVKKESMS